MSERTELHSWSTFGVCSIHRDECSGPSPEPSVFLVIYHCAHMDDLEDVYANFAPAMAQAKEREARREPSGFFVVEQWPLIT